ncbi:GNAT family N-acetyltransferase [Treponema zioleckii]|uniref:GNAT family N-acetyltransferase n=1 Tax=Treponema zioleckii TaxID=331680 RepID=UPI00168C0849|nr:GNAT family N-acetyltransferase [Treponema zioleckii]
MKAIRVDKDWQKSLVYYIRYKFVTEAARTNSDKRDFFTVDWEFEGDKDLDRYILILDDNDNPVSTVRFLIDDNNYGMIERVRTLPGEERKGYGKTAMIEGENWLRDLGVKKAFVEAIPAALQFYEKTGYAYSNNQDVLKKHDDLFLMEKSL